MEKRRIRTYRSDGDAIDIVETFHEKSGHWVGAFPCFELDKRYTPNGRPWVDITCGDECPYCDANNDGGACGFFRREKDKDVIAVCFCDALRIDPAKLGKNSTNGGNDK